MPADCALKIEAVLFDLDGTLVDTAPDLAWCLNTLRDEQGLAALSYASIRPHVSNGSAELIKFGFSISSDEPEFEPLRLRLLDLYANNLVRESRLFDDMETVLNKLESEHLPWGIVTNKPAWLTDPLLDKLHLTNRTACIVSGDTTTHSKPHPEPLLHACRLMQIAPDKCVYIGDAQRDIEAGRRAGMHTLVALFGYISDSDAPHQWGASDTVHEVKDIIGWLDAHISQ